MGVRQINGGGGRKRPAAGLEAEGRRGRRGGDCCVVWRTMHKYARMCVVPRHSHGAALTQCASDPIFLAQHPPQSQLRSIGFVVHS